MRAQIVAGELFVLQPVRVGIQDRLADRREPEAQVLYVAAGGADLDLFLKYSGSGSAFRDSRAGFLIHGRSLLKRRFDLSKRQSAEGTVFSIREGVTAFAVYEKEKVDFYS